MGKEEFEARLLLMECVSGNSVWWWPSAVGWEVAITPVFGESGQVSVHTCSGSHGLCFYFEDALGYINMVIKGGNDHE